MDWLLTDAADWALALLPVLLLLGIFVWLDAFALMTLREVLLLLLLGSLAALAAWPVAGRFLDTLPIGFSSYSRFVAPWIEEALKALAIIALFRMNRIGYKVDAVIAGFAIGAGFSVVENIFYLTLHPQYPAPTWMVRGLGTAIMHGATLALLAALAHEFAERETRGAAADFDFRWWWFVPGYLLAVLIHTIFNQFPDRPLQAMVGAAILGPLAILAIFHFGSAEAQRWLEREHAEHKAQLEALRTGRWPDGGSGKKVAAFASRLDAENANRVRRYWELQTYLVVEAEETLIEEASGDAEFDTGQIRAAFDELATLKRALGRSTVAILSDLLPFSRNDQWEVAELKQRLARD